MCTTSAKINMSTMIPVFGDSSYLAPNAINMHVSMPCPLKVPFRQWFTPFVESYNARHSKSPIYCPNISDCSSVDIEQMLATAKSEDDLPDIIITTNYRIILANGFYQRYIANGIYKGVIHKENSSQIPSAMLENLTKSNIGVLCFSSWCMIQDLTFDNIPQDIDSWSAFISPDFEGQITVHGHLDKATFGVAYFLKQLYGEEGLKQYARNIIDIKHFSQIIKRMASSDPDRTPFNLLPDVAASKIPSHKKVKVLNLKEGKILSPMIFMVKQAKLDDCTEILDKLWSEPFRAMLRDSGCKLIDELDPAVNYSLPDFLSLAPHYEALEKELDTLYLENLPLQKIEARITEGGVCK